MPLYEYSCPSCGHAFEELARSADADKAKCPKCGAKARRQLSVFSAAVAPDRPSGGPPPSCQSCPGAGTGTCPYK